MILASVLLVPAFFEVTLGMTNQGQPAGRRPSKLSSTLQNAVTRVHTVLYRSSNGVIGGRVANSPVLLLTTTGRRSGKQRTVPLLYLIDGRNVVLVRSCEVVLFVAGAMGSLNEFTIAHDEGKVIGCLTGTGGVADETEYLLQRFGKRGTTARIFLNEDPEKLLDDCLNALKAS